MTDKLKAVPLLTLTVSSRRENSTIRLFPPTLDLLEQEILESLKYLVGYGEEIVIFSDRFAYRFLNSSELFAKMDQFVAHIISDMPKRDMVCL